MSRDESGEEKEQLLFEKSFMKKANFCKCLSTNLIFMYLELRGKVHSGCRRAATSATTYERGGE